jgi:hypothetical protein
MNTQVKNGIQLPAYDMELLNSGKLISVPFKQTLKQGQEFWLYPCQQLPLELGLDEYYQPKYLNAAKAAFSKYTDTPIQIQAWGRAEYHWHIHPSSKCFLPQIAQSTIWNLSALENIFEQYQILKLLFLRVYRLAQPCIVNVLTQPGTYYWASSEDKVVQASKNDISVVSASSFEQRKSLLMSGEPYPFLALEALQLQIDSSNNDNIETKNFSHRIKNFLGWTNQKLVAQPMPQWINEISAKGNRSLQEDDGTSNYHAGTAFENSVRDSLGFLGFKIDHSHKGGAGGLDLFCSEPYPLVGECKSGKKIPNDTAVQLLNLGTIRLNNKEEFSRSVKLIIGPGEPTEQLKKAAKVHGMAIINPSTLEKLVKLHYRYPIDLFRLKDYLVDGQADDEVDKFITQVIQSIKLRLYIIKLVKKFLEDSHDSDAEIAQLHAVYIYSGPPQPLKREEMNEILIELSSPLTGYLGRKKGSEGSDRFYFLRDLLVD